MGFLFNDKSELTKKLNVILREVYSLNLIEENKSLESILDGKKVTSSGINYILQEVENAEDVISQLNQFDYSNQETNKKKEQTQKTAQYLDLVINELLSRSENKHYSSQEQLEKNKNNLNILKDIRIELNKENDYSLSLLSMGEKRQISYNTSETFFQYQEKRNKLNNLEEEIQNQEKRYDNLENSSNIGKERKSLLKETKDGFKKSKLVKSCIQEDYFEGTLRLQQLKENIIKSSPDYLQKKQKNNPLNSPTTELNYQDNYGFNFYAYILKMCSPQNFNYYNIQDLLEAKYGGNEPERFSKLANIIKKEKIKGKQDFDYFRTILFGFEHALNSPPQGFSQKEAKDVCHALKYSLRQVS